MTMMSMDELSRADALAYRDAVIARQPARLAQLAGWLQTTGGPLDELDATVDSLGELWPWFLTFVENDCPGIPIGAATQRAIMYEDPSNFTRAYCDGYAYETVSHYLMLVAQRLDPTAHWQSWTWKPAAYIHYQETGILLANGAFAIPDTYLGTALNHAINYPPERATTQEFRDPLALRRMFLGWANIPQAPHQDRGPAVLPTPQPVPNPPPVLWTPKDPRQDKPPRPSKGPIPYDTVTTEDTPPEPEPADLLAPHLPQPHPGAADLDVAALLGASSDLYLFRGPDQGIEEPELLQPLPREELTATLTSLGFTPTDEVPEPGTQAWQRPNSDPDLAIEAQITSTDGQARLLAVYFHGNPTTTTGKTVAATLVDLATRLDARITNYDEADIDD